MTRFQCLVSELCAHLTEFSHSSTFYVPIGNEILTSIEIDVVEESQKCPQHSSWLNEWKLVEL